MGVKTVNNKKNTAGWENMRKKIFKMMIIQKFLYICRFFPSSSFYIFNICFSKYFINQW